MSINRVTISGNLTRDPEIRQTGSGTSVMTFGVAVNDRRRNPQTNEWEDYPNYVDCVMFGSRADSLQRFLTKGTKVFVDGKLRYSSWERDGQRRSKLEVIVDDLDFGGGGRGNGGGNGGYSQSAPQQSYAQAVPQQNYAATAPVQMPQQVVQPAPQQVVSAPPVQQPPVQQPVAQQAAAPAPASAPVVQAPEVGVYDEEIPF